MRIVSQHGGYDLPYEMTIIYCELMCGGICNIKAIVNGEEGTVAEYSTKEKALKVMEMLRTQYKQLETTKLFIQGQEVNTEANGFKETVLEIRDSYIFRFPKDEEVEV